MFNPVKSLISAMARKLSIGVILLAVAFSAVFSIGIPTQVEAQSTGEVMSSCALENIGWIACPVIRAAARASDYAFTFISQSFMQVEVSMLQGDGGTARAWGITRNIANILFVLFLLVVVYGIITGRGVSNGSIKRMLPRFIVAAILVNFSFFLGQLAVDLSNIVGSSVQSAMTSIAGNDNIIAAPTGELGGEVGADGYIANDGAIARVTSAVLSSPNLAWVLLVPLSSVVMSVGIITAVMIVVLIIREVLIVALLLLAPIAFVLYLLPNTEQYFSRWLRMFTQLLMLFPVMALLLGAGQIVGGAVMSASNGSYAVSGDTYQTANGTSVSATTSLVAIGATVLPLLGTWFAFKGAMSAMDFSVSRLQGSGRRRDSSDPAKEAERARRASQSMQRNSLMNRGGSDRIKRVSDIQSESAGSVVGLAGNSVVRRRKKADKTPEQQQFDQQVQQRLGEIKDGVDSGQISATPQQIYVKALQSAEDSGGSAGGNRGTIGLGNFDSVELKAAEAYLLESIKSPSGNSVDPNSFLKQQQSTTRESQAQQAQQAVAQAQGKSNTPQPNQAIKQPGGDSDKDSTSSAIKAASGGGTQDSNNTPGKASGTKTASQELGLGRPQDVSGQESDAIKNVQVSASSGGGSSANAAGGDGINVNIDLDPSMLSVGRDSSGERGPSSRFGGVSASNPAAINERVPSRLQPITDLEKKAQGIAARHVAASQEKSGGVDSFEDELRLRAEKASLNPLRTLGARDRPNKDNKR